MSMPTHQQTLERDAITADAKQSLKRLQAARDRLLPHADDPYVLSEITSIERQILLTEEALRTNG